MDRLNVGLSPLPRCRCFFHLVGKLIDNDVDELRGVFVHNCTICCPLLSFPGYYGKSCTDACHLNPCENEAQCHRKPSSSHGYVCDCGDNHFGQYCQHRYTPAGADTHLQMSTSMSVSRCGAAVSRLFVWFHTLTGLLFRLCLSWQIWPPVSQGLVGVSDMWTMWLWHR